jgi:hypothetical protein
MEEESICLPSAASASTQPKNLLGCKVRPARTADSSAVVVVPNVKVGMEVQHSNHRLNVHDLLRESFTSYIRI